MTTAAQIDPSLDTLDRLYDALAPSLRGVGRRSFRAALKDLGPALDAAPQGRTQIRLVRLRFSGEKSAELEFAPGVNVLRAGNDKGKSSILKLIHFCLTGRNELKKDVDSWIDRVELAFELDGEPHAIGIDKKRRPRGRLVRGGLEALENGDAILEFKSAKEMQTELEEFFNGIFGLRPLMGTQKDPRKGSDALLDSPTSYRAYFRGMYINQDLGYTDLITDGVPYGNLFMKILGMLLGLGGIDAHFAVEAQIAHLENALAKEERYNRRVEETFGTKDLKTLDQEIKHLESYIDELKVERAALMVRATTDDLDQRLAELTQELIALGGAREDLARELESARLELETLERDAEELETSLAGLGALGAIQPDRCPICETKIAERQSEARRRAAEGECLLCHEELPAERRAEDLEGRAKERLAEVRRSLAERRRQVKGQAAELEGLGIRAKQLGRQKQHLQAQLRSAHTGTTELDREIEIETRYLGRLEAERDGAARILTAQDGSGPVDRMLRRKEILSEVLRFLRTREAEANERIKREFAAQVQEYCTTIGFPGLEEVSLDAQLRPRIRQNGEVYGFDEISPGEKVRFVLAFYLALAIATAEKLEYGAQPGLLLIDSPGKEEMVLSDFEAVVELLRRIEERHAESLQVIVATTVRAIAGATDPAKQLFIEKDDVPLFS